MPANPYYLLQVLVRGVTVDVRLNDVPAFVHHTGEEMTSSGESDTDRARKRTSGLDSPILRTTDKPPPPGMCTSTRTTSGLVLRIPSTA